MSNYEEDVVESVTRFEVDLKDFDARGIKLMHPAVTLKIIQNGNIVVLEEMQVERVLGIFKRLKKNAESK